MDKTMSSWKRWSMYYGKDKLFMNRMKYRLCKRWMLNTFREVLEQRSQEDPNDNFQTFRTVREYLLRAKILSFEPEASHISQFVTVVTVIDMHVSIGKAAAAQETTSRNGIVLPFNLSTSSRRTAYCPKKAKKATRWVNWYDAKEALKRLYFSDKFMSRQSCPRNQITQRCAHKWGASIIEHSQFSD